MNNDKLNPKYREKLTDPMKPGTPLLVDMTFNPIDIQSYQDL